MSLLIDQYGRPIILFDAENTKERLKGVEAYRVSYKYIIINQNYKILDKYFSSMWSCKFFKIFNGSKRYGQNAH